MSYGSEKRGLWLGGALRRPVVRTTNDGRRVECSTLAAVRWDFIFHTSRLVRLTTLDLYAAKPNIRPESRFLPPPPAFDAPDGEKISKICLFVLTWSTNVIDKQADRHTDTAWQHRSRLCIASRSKNFFREPMALIRWSCMYSRAVSVELQ